MGCRVQAVVACLGDSVRLLAALWTSAWKEGSGDRIAEAKLVKFKEEDLQKIYRSDRSFLPSLGLEEMAGCGDFEPPTARAARA